MGAAKTSATSVLITGARGYVGTYLGARLAASRSYVVQPLTSDVTAPDLWVPRADVVIHLAGKLNSFRGAEAELERINYDGTVHLARRCPPGAQLVFLSTDQVFASAAGREYRESDPAAPETAYGRSKLKAEQFLLGISERITILRTSVVYGYAHPQRQNTVAFIESKLGAGEAVELFADVFTSPTHIADLCACIERAITDGIFGVHHACGPEYLNRCDIGGAICRARGYPPSLIRAIPRPDSSNIPRSIRLRRSDVFADLLSTDFATGLRNEAPP